jgi:general stress protein 26
MSDLKAKIRGKMLQPTLSVLATITEDGKPWVRYVTPVMDDGLVIRLATFLHSRKVAHIKRNAEVHLATGVTAPETAESYLQVQGRAGIKTDPETKKAMWSDQLKRYFSGPDDPNYCVCEIVPYRIEYMSMNSMTPEVWEA